MIEAFFHKIIEKIKMLSNDRINGSYANLFRNSKHHRKALDSRDLLKLNRSIDPRPENVRLDDVVVNEYLTVKEYCSGHIGRSFKDAATDMVSNTTVLILLL